MREVSAQPTGPVHRRLQQEKIVWVATVRPNGAPHLTPVWFVWTGDHLFICISPNSRKARNLARNPQVAVSLEDGRNVVIMEGIATQATEDERTRIAPLFQDKYGWNILQDTTYTLLLKLIPTKFLTWGNDAQA